MTEKTHSERIEDIRAQIDQLADELPANPIALITNPGEAGGKLLNLVDNIAIAMEMLAADVDELKLVTGLDQ